MLNFEDFTLACTLPLLELDSGGQICNWNPAATKLFGYSKQEVLGQCPVDFLYHKGSYHSQTLAGLNGNSKSTLADLPTTLHCLSRTGQDLVCEWRTTQIFDAHQKLLRSIILIEDITDRERTVRRIAQLISEQDALLDNSVFGAAFLNNDHLLRCNETFATLCGYQIHEVIRQPFAHFLATPNDYPDLAQEIVQVIDHQGYWDGETRLQHKDGSNFWASLRISPIALPIDAMYSTVKTAKQARNWVVIMQDITQRREQQQQIQRLLFDLETERERALVTLEAIADAVLRVDAQGQIEFANTIALEVLGMREADLLGYHLSACLTIRDPHTMQHVNLLEPDLTHPLTTLTDNSNQIGLWIDHDGEERALEYSLSLLNGQTGADDHTGMVMVFRDVTEQRRLSEELSWQARHDTLTKLPNRRSFEMRVELALEGMRKLSQQHVVLFLDLDRFKIVNDTCGHAAGDELLKQLTHLMLAKVRKSDMLARMGGDEFAILLDSCDSEQAHKVAEAIRSIVQDFRFIWQDKVFRIGISIGAVKIDEHAHTLEDVLSCADYACYAAKEMGRNRVNFYLHGDHAQNHGKQEMEWLPRIHAALEQNRFELDLQQILPTVGGLVVNNDEEAHYEVLVRMIDESGVRVPPMSFIPPAERYGLMGQIDRWVVTEIFKQGEQLLSMHSRHFNGLLCVNLSGHSILDDSLIQFIQLRLSAYPQLAKHLCFEITETAAVSNLTRAANLMQSIKVLGARFALDDFGSGMSSFAYLRTLPVDFLKIDGVFIKNLVEDRINRAMVSGIHHVGQTMGLKTIAEFVENQAIVIQLKEIGVDYVQGFALHRPERFDLVAAQWRK